MHALRVSIYIRYYAENGFAGTLIRFIRTRLQVLGIKIRSYLRGLESLKHFESAKPKTSFVDSMRCCE